MTCGARRDGCRDNGKRNEYVRKNLDLKYNKMKNYLKLATSAVALLMVAAIVVTFEACRKENIYSNEDFATISFTNKYDGYEPSYTDISRAAPSSK